MRTHTLSLPAKERPSAALTTAQHCCMLHGWLSVLFPVTGDYAVIIHSDRDCSNLLPKHQAQRAEVYDRFFCTNLSDHDIITGKSLERLRECLELVLKKVKPRAVLVLGSCMSALINDNVDKVLKKFRQNSSVPIHYERTSGFSFNDPRTALDAAGQFFYDITKKDLPDHKDDLAINLIGFDHEPGSRSPGIVDLEADLLALAGIHINTIISPLTPLGEWAKVKQAVLNVTPDLLLYRELNKKLRSEQNISTIEAPYPVGLSATLDFYTKILEHFGLELNKGLHELRNKIGTSVQELKKYKKSLSGYRLYYNISSSLDFTANNSAKEGLIYLDFFRELGLNIQLLIQGNPEKENEEKVKNMLGHYSIDEPFAIFGHCGDAYKLFKDNGRVIVFGSDLLKQQTRECGHVFVPYHILEVGLKNIGTNIKKILEPKEEHVRSR